MVADTSAPAAPKSRQCFVICPFGKEGSPERARSDEIFTQYIDPVAKQVGYTAFRSIDLQGARPGVVTENVVDMVCDADLVIADLTGSNANVYYELALRHALGKPCIMLIEDMADLKFDIQDLNVIRIRKDFAGGQRTVAELRAQLEQIACGAAKFENAASRHFPQLSARSAKVFTWTIKYAQRLAADWLRRQDPAFVEHARKFDANRGIPSDPGQRNLLAQYVGFKFAQDENLLGTLYYRLVDASGSLEGWGNFSLPGSDPLSIPITGRDNRGDLTVHFRQPGRNLEIAPGLLETIPPYNFSVVFTRHGSVLEGDLNHPDFPDSEPLLLGLARLSPIE